MIQGVLQNSLRFSISNFSAYDVLRIFILDIFQLPFPSAIQNCPKFWRLNNFWLSYEGNTDRGTKQNPTKFMFNWSICLQFTFYNFHNIWLMSTIIWIWLFATGFPYFNDFQWLLLFITFLLNSSVSPETAFLLWPLEENIIHNQMLWSLKMQFPFIGIGHSFLLMSPHEKKLQNKQQYL